MARFTGSVGHEILWITVTVISADVLQGGFMKQMKWVNGLFKASLFEEQCIWIEISRFSFSLDAIFSPAHC